MADSEPAAPTVSPVLHLPYVNQSVDLQVLLIGDANRDEDSRKFGTVSYWQLLSHTHWKYSQARIPDQPYGKSRTGKQKRMQLMHQGVFEGDMLHENQC